MVRYKISTVSPFTIEYIKETLNLINWEVDSLNRIRKLYGELYLRAFTYSIIERNNILEYLEIREFIIQKLWEDRIRLESYIINTNGTNVAVRLNKSHRVYYSSSANTYLQVICNDFYLIPSWKDYFLYFNSQFFYIKETNFIKYNKDTYNFESIHGKDFCTEHLFNAQSGHLIPQVLMSKYYRKCAECNTNWIPICTTEFCKVCGEIFPTGAIMNAYSTKAPDYLPTYKKKESDHLFGVELELESNKSEFLTQLRDIYKAGRKFILCKRDGSLINGVEIVTSPADFETQITKFEKIYEALNSTNTFVAKNNCGIHIHVGRATLSQLQIGRMCEFIYNEENEKLVIGIARRKSSMGAINKDGDLTCLSTENSYRTHDRYSAINLQPKHTIEFRIFASTTEYNIFRSYIEFVKSLIDYTTPGAINIPSVYNIKEQKNYLAYTKQYHKFYPNLINRLIELEFLQPRKLRKDM